MRHSLEWGSLGAILRRNSGRSQKVVLREDCIENTLIKAMVPEWKKNLFLGKEYLRFSLIQKLPWFARVTGSEMIETVADGIVITWWD